MLNFVGAGPPEMIAEWAFVPWHVYIPHVPLELLGPSELFVADSADMRFHYHRSAHVMFTVASGILGDCMFSDCERLSLGHVLVCTRITESPGGKAVLPGRVGSCTAGPLGRKWATP